MEEEFTEEYTDFEEETSEFNSEVDSEEESSVTDDQIISAIRELIEDENSFTRDSVSGNEIPPEGDSSSAEIIDYTQLLTDIKNQNIQISSQLQTIIDNSEMTIFDKELNEYNITDTILVVLVVFGLILLVISFIKKFTPKIWR